MKTASEWVSELVSLRESLAQQTETIENRFDQVAEGFFEYLEQFCTEYAEAGLGHFVLGESTVLSNGTVIRTLVTEHEKWQIVRFPNLLPDPDRSPRMLARIAVFRGITSDAPETWSLYCGVNTEKDSTFCYWANSNGSLLGRAKSSLSLEAMGAAFASEMVGWICCRRFMWDTELTFSDVLHGNCDWFGPADLA